MQERRLKSRVSKDETYVVTVEASKCRFAGALKFAGEPANLSICCMYGVDYNIYVCKYSGEEVRVNNAKEQGLATSYCTHK